MRINKADIENQVNVINNIMKSKGKTADFMIDGAYGKVRLARQQGAKGISPLLSKSELYMWINAFIEGMDIFYNQD